MGSARMANPLTMIGWHSRGRCLVSIHSWLVVKLTDALQELVNRGRINRVGVVDVDFARTMKANAENLRCGFVSVCTGVVDDGVSEGPW